MKYNNHASFKRIVRGRGLDLDKKLLINKMFYDEFKTVEDIKRHIKIGQTVLDRELFCTRGEWDEFKQRRR